ncbi:hypothetical protein EJB05_14262, partial [Eragrostis curvula]
MVRRGCGQEKKVARENKCSVPRHCSCDHRNCHGGPFLVLVLGLGSRQGPVHARVYSSKARAWGTPVSFDADTDAWFELECGALVRDELCYRILDDKILEYDLSKNCLSLIDPPNLEHDDWSSFVLMLMEDRSLGLVGARGSSLYLWSRKMKPDGVVVGWDLQPSGDGSVVRMAKWRRRRGATGRTSEVAPNRVQRRRTPPRLRSGTWRRYGLALDEARRMLAAVDAALRAALGLLVDNDGRFDRVGGSWTIMQCAMSAPPELNGDATAEILLRLLPDEPAHLVRAALVCKPWRQILTDPAFLRRYRAFHRAPPLLGFFNNFAAVNDLRHPSFFSTLKAASPFPTRAFDCAEWIVLDCRHGRVLFGLFAETVSYVVWDLLGK